MIDIKPSRVIKFSFPSEPNNESVCNQCEVPEDLHRSHRSLRLDLIPESDRRPHHGFCNTGRDLCALLTPS